MKALAEINGQDESGRSAQTRVHRSYLSQLDVYISDGADIIIMRQHGKPARYSRVEFVCHGEDGSFVYACWDQRQKEGFTDMDAIEAVTAYRAKDGTLFETLDGAESHNMVQEIVAEIEEQCSRFSYTNLTNVRLVVNYICANYRLTPKDSDR